MSGGAFTLDASQLDGMAGALKAYPGNAERALNEVMHEEAGPDIYARINPLIHPSGRTFKGHSKSARASKWPRYDTGENLAVTVGTKSRYRYLYFPDDGESTRRHAGRQGFFKRGAEYAAPGIAERCLGALLDGLERL